MEDGVRKRLLADLRSLRPLLLTERGRPFLDLFDEFMEHHEFELALHVVCDFILEPDSPHVDKSTIDQIQRLHIEMEIEDHCVEELRSQKTRMAKTD